MVTFIVLYDFNLLLPTREDLINSLTEFNELRSRNGLTLYSPDVVIDGFETHLFQPDNTPPTYIGGEVTLPPADITFRVYDDIVDYTPERVSFSFVEFLCEKFGGTMVGIYTCGREPLNPVKIIGGKRIPCDLLLVDRLGEDNGIGGVPND